MGKPRHPESDNQPPGGESEPEPLPEVIDDDLAHTAAASSPATEARDVHDIERPYVYDQNTGGLAARSGKYVIALAPIAYFLFRNLWPNPRFGKWRLVTRYHDVREVMDRDEVFEVPFDVKAAKLDWNPGFLLGMQDGADYRRTKEDVYRIFRRDDVSGIVRQVARDTAFEILRNHAPKPGPDGVRQGRIDVVREFVQRVPTRVAEQYYGIGSIENEAEFEDCLVAVSSYFFGFPDLKDKDVPPHVLAAHRIVREVLQNAIDSRRQANQPDRDDILGRLLAEQQEDPDYFTDERIVSYLYGMTLGFLPTNLMANGNILDALMKHELARAQARRAALDDDDALLTRCLFETMRRYIPLRPFAFRRCEDNYALPPRRSLWDRLIRRRLVRRGEMVMVATPSAMRDSRGVRRPREFDPDRPAEHNLVFGFGLHHCIGRHIAEEQITQAMKVLLTQGNLQRARGSAGRMRRHDLFPRSLTVTYEYRGPEEG